MAQCTELEVGDVYGSVHRVRGRRCLWLSATRWAEPVDGPSRPVEEINTWRDPGAREGAAGDRAARGYSDTTVPLDSPTPPSGLHKGAV